MRVHPYIVLVYYSAIFFTIMQAINRPQKGHNTAFACAHAHMRATHARTQVDESKLYFLGKMQYIALLSKKYKLLIC